MSSLNRLSPPTQPASQPLGTHTFVYQGKRPPSSLVPVSVCTYKRFIPYLHNTSGSILYHLILSLFTLFFPFSLSLHTCSTVHTLHTYTYIHTKMQIIIDPASRKEMSDKKARDKIEELGDIESSKVPYIPR